MPIMDSIITVILLSVHKAGPVAVAGSTEDRRPHSTVRCLVSGGYTLRDLYTRYCVLTK